jgi:hypothetical protein
MIDGGAAEELPVSGCGEDPVDRAVAGEVLMNVWCAGRTGLGERLEEAGDLRPSCRVERAPEGRFVVGDAGDAKVRAGDLRDRRAAVNAVEPRELVDLNLAIGIAGDERRERALQRRGAARVIA